MAAAAYERPPGKMLSFQNQTRLSSIVVAVRDAQKTFGDKIGTISRNRTCMLFGQPQLDSECPQ